MDIKIYYPKFAFLNDYGTMKIGSKDCGQTNTTVHKSAVNCHYGKNYVRPILNNSVKNLKLSFTGYYGDPQPLKKLFWYTTQRNSIYEDD